MRRRIALQSTSCEILVQTPLLFREAFGVRARPRAALDLWMSYSGADGAQITFGRSRHRDFSVGQDIRFPPTAVDLLE